MKLAVVGVIEIDDNSDIDTDGVETDLLEAVMEGIMISEDKVTIRVVAAPTDLTIGKLNEIVTGVAD